MMPAMRQTHAALLAVCAILGFGSNSLEASEIPILTGCGLTSWSQKDGLPPGSVRAVAQDHKGYLWVGTDGGLVRFDGLRFVNWDALHSTPLPNAAVRVLIAARDGSIWIGFANDRGVARLHGGQVQMYAGGEGIMAGTVTAIVEDQSGTVWVGGTGGLFKRVGERWQQIGGEFLTGGVATMFAHGSRLLLGNSYGVLQAEAPYARFEPIEKLEDVPRSIALDRTGRLVVTDQIAGFTVLGDEQRAEGRRAQGRGSRLLSDRDGNLWVGTIGQGLWRVRWNDDSSSYQIERASALTGLPSDGVLSLAEDRYGNIWAATTEGLSRFTKHKFGQITSLGLVNAVAATPSGDVWVGSFDGLMRFPQGDPKQTGDRISLEGARLMAIHADREGRLWVATDRSVGSIEKGRLRPISTTDRLGRITWLSSRADGHLWAYVEGRGLTTLHTDSSGSSTVPAWLANASLITAFNDRAGLLWTSLSDGRIAAVGRDHEVRVYDRTHGLDAGVYQTIYEDASGTLWLGGTRGLSRRLDDGGFVTLPVDEGFPGEVTTILDDANGWLWLGMPFGVIKFQRDEFERSAADPSHQFRYVRYDRADGLAGMPLASYGTGRRSARAMDGRLWFVTGRGISVIDPDVVDQRTHRYPVRVERLIGNTGTFHASPDMTLPSLTTKLEIHYTTLNLTSPLKTRFRYRLDGFDTDWVEAGTRQEAFYTGLPPGDYRFRVTATNDENAWSEDEGMVVFTIAPVFYQTAWFAGLCVAALVVATWAAWALHVRRIRATFSLLINERARLSREIHDTLLQGLVGVTLQLDAMASGAEHESPTTRDQFVRLRKRVEEYIRDARQSICDLRSPPVPSRNLSSALRCDAEATIANSGVALDFLVVGRPVDCSPHVQEELRRIAREAVTNALRHARATLVQIELSYREFDVRLSVSDDGCGFDPVSVAAHGSAHYGLKGIRERIRDLGGSLNIVSHTGSGTLLETTIPMDRLRA
jgi:signal transduction histidine kinase/ligand-binding sensor domain-containing protein